MEPTQVARTPEDEFLERAGEISERFLGNIESVVHGHTRELDDPFLRLATENPIEYEGTFPLPEVQLDRFLLKTQLGYPGAEDEVPILVEQRYGHPLGSLRPVLDVDEVRVLRRA